MLEASVGIVVGFLLGVYFQAGRTKWDSNETDPPEELPTEFPEGCKLVQLGKEYAFKVGDKFADMGGGSYDLWYHPSHVQKHCLTKSKSRAIKRGIETYHFYKEWSSTSAVWEGKL